MGSLHAIMILFMTNGKINTLHIVLFTDASLNLIKKRLWFILCYFLKFKVCVHYFLSKFHFSPNGSPPETMKNVFYFMWKKVFSFLRYSNFCIFVFPPLFFPVSHCFRGLSNYTFCLISYETRRDIVLKLCPLIQN